jgi:hypothetical protein
MREKQFRKLVGDFTGGHTRMNTLICEIAASDPHTLASDPLDLVRRQASAVPTDEVPTPD